LLDLSDEELLARIEADPNSLGPLSIGEPGSGRLFNAVAMPRGPRWEIRDGIEAWGTAETIAATQTAIDTVHELFPETMPVHIGDLSDQDGGRLKRHESHQCGRDIDVGFYFKGEVPAGFVVGTAKNLDLPRNWALVRALLVRTDVEAILLDTRIQKLLYQHALSISEDKEWLDQVFRFSRGSRDAVIRHVVGHRNHYHVRFYSPVARELGRRAYPMLVEQNLMSPPVFTVRHLVRPGQTLGHLASRYGTSVRAIMQANGLRSTNLRAGRSYRIPVRAAVPRTEPLVAPRRLVAPYTPPELASIAWPTAELLYGSGGDR
jgi:penicillin-insensitive murein endopeptidase